jgi:hypothetical protein
MSIDIPSDDEFDALSDDDLRSLFWTALGLNARSVALAAKVWCKMEGRGMDLSAVKLSIRGYFRRVAEGSVLPDTVARFAGTALLRKVAALSLFDQKRLVESGTVAVVVKSGDQYTDYKMALADLRNGLVSQVFGDGFVRDVAAQIAYIEGSKPAAWIPARPVLGGKVKVDRAAGTVRIGKTIVAAQDVIDALRASGMV